MAPTRPHAAGPLRECAVIDYAPQRLSVIGRTSWRRPDAGDAEFSAAALDIVIWAEHLSPSMPISLLGLDAPAPSFGIRERRFDFLLWVWSWHSSMRQDYRPILRLSTDNLG